MLELSLEEQETSISQMGDDRSKWLIVSDDNVWKARLQKMGFKPVREQGPTLWFEVPATCVIVRKQPTIKPMSDERREKSREQLQRMHDARQAKKNQTQIGTDIGVDVAAHG